MSYMFELHYSPPDDAVREAHIASQITACGGRLTFREPVTKLTGIVLTFEFDELPRAEAAHAALAQQGEHVENICDYAGD